MRPRSFGDVLGFVFDIVITPEVDAAYKGSVAAFVANRKLYVVMYLGADPYYYEKYRAIADATLASARQCDAACAKAGSKRAHKDPR